jgi:hypothetical protein
MSLPRLRTLLRFSPPTADERAVLKVQIPLFVAVSILLTLGYQAQRELRAMAEREHVQLFLRGWDGMAWYVWLLAAPAMLVLIRRFPLVRGSVFRNAGWLVSGNLLLYFGVTNLRFFLRILPNLWLPAAADLPLDWEHYALNLLVTLPMDFLTFSGFFFASFAIDYHFKYSQRAEESLQLKLRAAQLESDLARAELAALRGQLHPHFLFNSFNAVSALVRQGRSEDAVEVISRLSSLLRLAIERTGQQDLPLEEEIDFLRRYLEIERVRFGDKLRFGFAIAASAADASVPNLILQPLVENAIKHGISRLTQPGEVKISVQRSEARLQVEVLNDGPDGLPDERAGPAGGIGLSNTRTRLEKIFGADFRLEMQARPEGGMRVRLDIPWRPVTGGVIFA